MQSKEDKIQRSGTFSLLC